MLQRITILAALAATITVHAQTTGPEVTAWILNPGSETGYGGILSNVQEVQYGDANVYVSCTCIPGYDIGPWAGNPNTPANQDFVFKITRTPVENTGTLVATPMGHIGVWRNGVSIFNARDGMSYQNEGIWNQNAVTVEGPSFDLCNGHPAPNGEYHHHLNPSCLYDDQNDQAHSPIIGYAFDGFPIYGAYGFSNTDGTGGIRRIESSWRLRDITERHALPDGTVLNASQYGPNVAGQYVLGYYIEDFEFVDGLGDLDVHNGRACVTPDYPDGIYAYFVTLDSLGEAAFPYTLGETYYGTVPAGNTGPQSGHNTVSEPVLTWDGSMSTLEIAIPAPSGAYPNPSTGQVFVPSTFTGWTIHVIDVQGRTVRTERPVSGAGVVQLELGDLVNGSYTLIMDHEGVCSHVSIVIAH